MDISGEKSSFFLVCCCAGDLWYACESGFILDDIEKGDVATPIDFKHVRRAMYYLKKLNCEAAVSEFEKWNESVKNNVLNSSEFKVINQPDFYKGDYRLSLTSLDAVGP